MQIPLKLNPVWSKGMIRMEGAHSLYSYIIMYLYESISVYCSAWSHIFHQHTVIVSCLDCQSCMWSGVKIELLLFLLCMCSEKVERSVWDSYFAGMYRFHLQRKTIHTNCRTLSTVVICGNKEIAHYRRCWYLSACLLISTACC